MNRTYGTRRLAVLVTSSILLMSSLATAAPPKVVVVPLGGSKVAGTNGQVQYNDDGKIAGAEVYYDTSTGLLEVKGEIRSSDTEGDNRLWGEGRPGVSVPIWTEETIKGYHQGRSNQATGWDNTAAGCPRETWVCTLQDWDSNFNLGDQTPRANWNSIASAWWPEELLMYAWSANRYEDTTGEHGAVIRSYIGEPVSRTGMYNVVSQLRPLCCKHP